jgi:hypothetical protein
LGADLVRVLDLEGALVAAYTVFSRAIRFIMSFSLEHLSGVLLGTDSNHKTEQALVTAAVFKALSCHSLHCG